MEASMSESDSSLKEYFTGEHRRCDELWAEIEAGAESEGGQDVATRFERFAAALGRHLRMEEEVLFPAFEEATGMHDAGPTFVMRSEHEQMRGLLEQMRDAASEVDELVDLGDTLLMLIQQHNQKEENMLYPMAEQALAAKWADIREKLARYGE
jgi:hemerythrin-like domain-containing protein